MAQAFEKELSVSLAAVRAATRLCRAVQSRISAEAIEKKDRSPVTVADFGSQALVCKALAQAFAGDPVVAEEDSAVLRDAENHAQLQQVTEQVSAIEPGATVDQVCRWIDHGGAHDYAPRLWTLDPIDGTKGFVRNEQYAISLALIIEGQIELGVLGCPNLTVDPAKPDDVGVLFYAVRGQGAFAVSLDDSDAPPKPIAVSRTSNTRDARFCESVESGHSSHGDSEAIAKQLNITQPPIRRDSQAKYATVARGEADIYMRLPTNADYREKIWDHAGGVLVVTEAGGKVTDITGKRLDFTRGDKLENNRGVIVSNGQLHDAMLAAVEAVGVT